jgi:hypothetical protein
MEYSLLYIKAEHMGSRCEELVRNLLLSSDFTIVQEKKIILTESMLRIHQKILFEYTSEKNLIWQKQVRDRMVNSKINFYLVKGKNAVQRVSKIKEIIRSLYCPIEFDEKTQTTFPNCIHAPTNNKELLTDISVFVPEKLSLIKAINRIKEYDKEKQFSH